MQSFPADGVKTITETIFRNLAAGNETATMGALHPEAGLVWDGLTEVWAYYTNEHGALQGFADTHVEAPGQGAPPEVVESWAEDPSAQACRSA